MYSAMFVITISYRCRGNILSISDVEVIIDSPEVTEQMINYLEDLYSCNGKYNVSVEHTCVNKK